MSLDCLPLTHFLSLPPVAVLCAETQELFFYSLTCSLRLCHSFLPDVSERTIPFIQTRICTDCLTVIHGSLHSSSLTHVLLWSASVHPIDLLCIDSLLTSLVASTMLQLRQSGRLSSHSCNVTRSTPLCSCRLLQRLTDDRRHSSVSKSHAAATAALKSATPALTRAARACPYMDVAAAAAAYSTACIRSSSGNATSPPSSSFSSPTTASSSSFSSAHPHRRRILLCASDIATIVGVSGSPQAFGCSGQAEVNESFKTRDPRYLLSDIFERVWSRTEPQQYADRIAQVEAELGKKKKIRTRETRIEAVLTKPRASDIN